MRTTLLLSSLFCMACSPSAKDSEDTSSTSDSGDDTESTSDSGDSTPLTDVLGENFEQDLIRKDGCGDVFLWAANVDDTLALAFEVSGPVAEAYAQNDKIRNFEYPLTGGQASLVITYGQHTSHTFCNDAIEHEVVVTKEFRPTEGVANLQITPFPDDASGPNTPADATLYLNNVTLESDDGETAFFERFRIDAGVGWLPG